VDSESDILQRFEMDSLRLKKWNNLLQPNDVTTILALFYKQNNSALHMITCLLSKLSKTMRTCEAARNFAANGAAGIFKRSTTSVFVKEDGDPPSPLLPFP